MKYTLILLALLISSLCFSQQEQRNFGIAEVFRSGDSIFIKKLTTQVVNVSEGTVTKMRTPPDTAKLFIAPDGGIYEGIITWRKVGGVPAVPILIQAENVTSIVNAAVVGTIIGNIISGAVIKYAAVDMGTRTKIKFRYSRGYTGSGSITFKVGSTSSILTFPSTGSWSTWQDIEFTIPSASGVIEINSSVIGPCNMDNFSIY